MRCSTLKETRPILKALAIVLNPCSYRAFSTATHAHLMISTGITRMNMVIVTYLTTIWEIIHFEP